MFSQTIVGGKMMPDFLNVQEASQLIRLKPSTIYFYCESGRLAHLKVGSRVLLEKSVLLEWLLSHRVDPVTSAR